MVKAESMRKNGDPVMGNNPRNRTADLCSAAISAMRSSIAIPKPGNRFQRVIRG